MYSQITRKLKILLLILTGAYLMNRQSIFQVIVVGILLLGIIVGCAPRQPMFPTEKGDYRTKYLDHATDIVYPDVNEMSYADVDNPINPFTLDNSKPREEWKLSLQEAINIALENSNVIRTLNGVSFGASGTFGTPGSLLSSPAGAMTSWDPAIVETDPRYGIAAALSEFDAVLSSQIGFTRSNELSTLTRNPTTSDNGVFQTTISKTAITGGTFYVTNDNRFVDGTGSDSYWSTYVEGGFSQPLLRGSGHQYNRIAGPGAIPGFNNGILVARINHDMSLTNFEISIRNLVAQVEEAYWNLYFAYYNLDSVIAGRDAAERTWQQIEAHVHVGGHMGGAQAESQAHTQYLIFKGQAETAQNNLFSTEAKLRYIIGIAPTDGRLIVPASEPTIAPLRYDYSGVVAEALARSPELRMQKWDVRKKELELIAQKNYILPQLDLRGNLRWNGLGDRLLHDNNSESNAYGSMVHDGQNSWGISLNFSKKLGDRQGHAAVRNAELAKARSRKILQEQELELVHQLSDAYRDLSLHFTLSQTNYDKRVSARKELEATTQFYNEGRTTLDQVLDAQRRLAEADTQYYRSLVDYNIAISTLHLRKGSLLEYNSVMLAEGPWPNKAVQHDAVLQARKRASGYYMNYGYTSPKVVSRGKYNQFQNNEEILNGETFMEEGEIIIDETQEPILAPVQPE